MKKIQIVLLNLALLVSVGGCNQEPEAIPTDGRSDNFSACVRAYEKIGDEFMRCNYPRPETDDAIISVCEQYDEVESVDCTVALKNWGDAHQCNRGSLHVSEDVMTCDPGVVE